MVELLMRMALDGFEGGFRIGGRCIMNLRYADDIVLIASSEEELQQLVNRVHEAASDMNMKVLGVVLDRRLSFDRHATSVARACKNTTSMPRPSDTSAVY